MEGCQRRQKETGWIREWKDGMKEAHERSRKEGKEWNGEAKGKEKEGIKETGTGTRTRAKKTKKKKGGECE